MANILQSFVAAPETPIEDVAISITSELFPRPDGAIALTHSQLDRLVDELPVKLARCKDLRGVVTTFTSHVYASLGFAGDSEHYYDPRNSDLLSVIERRKGIPISMAVVLMAMGRRVGITVEGVGFPGHFLARVGGTDGYIIDPFSRGLLMDEPSLERLIRKQFGPKSQLAPEHFSITSHAAIAQRMLHNLYAIYNARREHSHALLVADRLFSLNERVEHQRDRGLQAHAMGATLGAKADLEAYLEARPNAADRAQIETLLAASAAKPTRAN